MINSTTGFLIAGLLVLFGVWQYNKQRNSLADLTKGTEKKDISSLRAFLIRQARRRMHTGLLFILAGAAFFAGLRTDLVAHPNLSVSAWFVSVLFLLWAILLTVIDIFEIRFRYSEEKSVREAARRGLEYLRRQKREDFPGEDAPGNLIGKDKE